MITSPYTFISFLRMDHLIKKKVKRPRRLKSSTLSSNLLDNLLSKLPVDS